MSLPAGSLPLLAAELGSRLTFKKGRTERLRRPLPLPVLAAPRLSLKPEACTPPIPPPPAPPQVPDPLHPHHQRRPHLLQGRGSPGPGCLYTSRLLQCKHKGLRLNFDGMQAKGTPTSPAACCPPLSTPALPHPTAPSPPQTGAGAQCGARGVCGVHRGDHGPGQHAREAQQQQGLPAGGAAGGGSCCGSRGACLAWPCRQAQVQWPRPAGSAPHTVHVCILLTTAVAVTPAAAPQYCYLPIRTVIQAPRRVDPRGKTWNRMRASIGQVSACAAGGGGVGC